jgi:hypothetical protein
MTINFHRGHKIEEISPEVWVYSDTKQKVSENKDRQCGNCNKPNREDGHDACLGELKGIMNACCSHGDESGASVQFLDGHSVHGKDAIIILDILKRTNKD